MISSATNCRSVSKPARCHRDGDRRLKREAVISRTTPHVSGVRKSWTVSVWIGSRCRGHPVGRTNIRESCSATEAGAGSEVVAAGGCEWDLLRQTHSIWLRLARSGDTISGTNKSWSESCCRWWIQVSQYGKNARIQRRPWCGPFANMRQTRAAGNMYINRNMIGAVVGAQPFGQCGLSGIGRSGLPVPFWHRSDG